MSQAKDPAGTARADYHAQDRARGAGLPSVLNKDSYGRLSAAMSRRAGTRLAAQVEQPPAEPAAAVSGPMKRYSSVAAVRDAGFVPVAPGLFRRADNHTAHAIWELRAAEDGGAGYELVRKREERDVDLRRAGAGTVDAVAAGIVRTASRRTASASPAGYGVWVENPRTHEHRNITVKTLKQAEARVAAYEARGLEAGYVELEGAPRESRGQGRGMPQVGQRVLAMSDGAVAEAVVIMVRPQERAVDLLFGGPSTGAGMPGEDAGFVDENVPVEMLVDSDPFDVEIEPESKVQPIEEGPESGDDGESEPDDDDLLGAMMLG